MSILEDAVAQYRDAYAAWVDALSLRDQASGQLTDLERKAYDAAGRVRDAKDALLRAALPSGGA
jgi:hypothetical protein